MRRLLPLVLIASLAACSASEGAYPSLARRPAESTFSAIPAVAPAPAATAAPDPTLPARLAALRRQADDSHARFMARRPQTAARVSAAAGAAPGSEAWSLATVALAALESARSDTMIALADVDSLDAEMRVALNYNAQVAALRQDISALVAQEDAVLAQLGSRIRD